jgi:hypothetical protein
MASEQANTERRYVEVQRPQDEVDKMDAWRYRPEHANGHSKEMLIGGRVHFFFVLDLSKSMVIVHWACA